MQASAVALQEIVDHAIESHHGKIGALLPVLHSIQNKLGFVPKQAVPDFRSEPPGENIIHLCRAEACQAMGSRELEEHVINRLGIGYGETTADGLVSLEPVYCLGNCACTPTIRVNDDIHARVTAQKFDELIDRLEANS
jgi:formate dehydrogenase subunit gamma